MAPDRARGLPEEAEKVHPMINRNVSDSEKRSIDQQTKPVDATLVCEHPASRCKTRRLRIFEERNFHKQSAT
jgi:hypothetical protein